MGRTIPLSRGSGHDGKSCIAELRSATSSFMKGGLAELQGLGPRLHKDKPIALYVPLGQQKYDAVYATKYIEFRDWPTVR